MKAALHLLADSWKAELMAENLDEAQTAKIGQTI